MEVTPISGITDHYFITKFFKKKLGKIKQIKNNMPFSWFLSRKECKFPRVVHIPIFWQLLGIFSLASSKFLSKHQVISSSCYVFIFLSRINYNFDKKSHFLEIKCRNLKKFAKFLKGLGYQVKFWTKCLSSNVRHFNKFLCFFISWKNLV